MKPSVIIRPARQSDLTVIYRIAKAPELKAPNHQSEDRAWIRDHLKERQILLVSEHNRQVIGFVMGETATSHVAILHLISILPSRRQKGIGTLLLSAFEHEVLKRNTWCILSYVSVKSHLNGLLITSGYSRGSRVREFQKFLRKP